MFVRIEREKAIHRTTTGPKKALFQKELMWNKRERKQQQIQQQRELEEEKRNEKRRVKLEQRSASPGTSGKKKKSPSKIKDRFAQQRQIGFEVTAADQDGFEASRWVQPATTQNAGPLAPWACSNPEATEKGYDTQTFPLWDVETVKALTPEPHRHLANRNNLTGLELYVPDSSKTSTEIVLPTITASEARVNAVSWANKDYGLASRLEVGAATAVVLAMKKCLPICSLGLSCGERVVTHLRSCRHIQLEEAAEKVVSIVMTSRKYANVNEDGFLIHKHYRPNQIPKNQTSMEYKAGPSASMTPSVRRPLPPPGCVWSMMRIKFGRASGDYEGYVQRDSTGHGGVVPEGRGTMVWLDGNVYRGEWKDGIMHGELGEFWSSADESLYRGNFYRGKRQGNGEYYVDGHEREKERYVGGFQNGEFSGQGIYYLNDGTTLYDGSWQHDMWNGIGKIYWRNGEIKYNGDFINGIRHGHGTFYRSNGDLAYRGALQKGKYHGKGKFFNPRGRKSTGWASGTFHRGELTDSDSEVTFYIGEDTFVHYIGNIDRGRICGFGKVKYPDKRVSHGTRKRARLPLVRHLGQDAKLDREDNTLWYTEGQCWVGGEQHAGFVDTVIVARKEMAKIARSKKKKGKRLTDQETKALADLDEDEGIVTVEILKETTANTTTSSEQKNTETTNIVKSKGVRLVTTGTIIFSDDSRYDGDSTNGQPHGPHGIRIGPSGRCSFGTFFNGSLVLNTKKNQEKGIQVDGVAWRLVVYKCKILTYSGHFISYRNGSRISDDFPFMSATSALWLWFSKQDRGTFGGDKIRDRNGPTMRSAQLDMMFEVVQQRRKLCGNVRTLKNSQTVDINGDKIKVLKRGCLAIEHRKEFSKTFEICRGDSTWPKIQQTRYRALVHFLRSTMGN